MSKIIKEVEGRDLGHIVQTDDGVQYYVDSADTYDAGYETMVFLYDEEDDDVFDWGELFVERYRKYERMEKRHMEICKNLERFLHKERRQK